MKPADRSTQQPTANLPPLPLPLPLPTDGRLTETASAGIMAPIIDIKDDTEARGASLLADGNDSSGGGSKIALFFYAEWHEPSAEGGPFDLVVKTLANQGHGGVQFYRVLAEEAPSLSNKVKRSDERVLFFGRADV